MSFWQSKFKIGSIEVPRFIGGPLDGITDSPFRQIVRDFSKDELLFTEMRHVSSVAHPKGCQLALTFDQLERPLNYQISANQIGQILPACERILATGVDMIDLNIGCPAKNVVRSGSGSALMSDLPRLKSILETIRAAVPIPFTLKMRAGFKSVNAVTVAMLAQDCGVDAISIHPRLQTQLFEGQPDYTVAAAVKAAVSIPVIISGGVVNWATAQRVHEITGVDGFLIGRGIWGRPWKLKELHENSQGREFIVTPAMVLNSAVNQLNGMIKFYGPRGLFAFRKHLPFYLKGRAGVSEIRARLAVSSSAEEVEAGLRDFWKE